MDDETVSNGGDSETWLGRVLDMERRMRKITMMAEGNLGMMPEPTHPRRRRPSPSPPTSSHPCRTFRPPRWLSPTLTLTLTEDSVEAKIDKMQTDLEGKLKEVLEAVHNKAPAGAAGSDPHPASPAAKKSKK